MGHKSHNRDNPNLLHHCFAHPLGSRKGNKSIPLLHALADTAGRVKAYSEGLPARREAVALHAAQVSRRGGRLTLHILPPLPVLTKIDNFPSSQPGQARTP